MDKRQLVKIAAQQSTLTKRQLDEAVDVIFATIAKALVEGETVVLRSFGRFYTQVHLPYHIREVRTGSPYLVGSRPLPLFRSSAALRRRLRESRNPQHCERSVPSAREEGTVSKSPDLLQD